MRNVNQVRRHKCILAAALWFSFAVSSQACEPIIPFIKVVGGPGLLTRSWIILFLAVALKTLLFAVLQKHLSFIRASLLMFAGNVLTAFVGVLAAAMIGSGPIMLIGIFIVWGLSLIPARRLLTIVKHPCLGKFNAAGLAGSMSLALAASCLLFGISARFADTNQLMVYWVWKIIAVYLALAVSIILTAFWEEWVVWKFSSCPADYSGYVQPVIRANLVVLMCIMLFAAAVTLPKRLKSPNFLVKLGLNRYVSFEQKKPAQY